jgi:hypothetical protein
MAKHRCVAGCSNKRRKHLHLSFYLTPNISQQTRKLMFYRNEKKKQNTRRCKPYIYIMGLLRQNIT